jgi:hypothetical protein
MNKQLLILVTALAAGGLALAQGDPMEGFAKQQAMAQAPGAELVQPYFHGAGEKTDWQIMLDGGRCYWFSGVSSGPVKKLAMYLWEPGKWLRVADVKSTSGTATLAHCATVSGMYKFQAKIEGSGTYVIGAFAKAAPKQVETPVVEKKGPELGPLCDRRAAGAAPGAKRVGDFFEGKGNSIGHDDRFDFPVQMDGGKCYWIVGCGEPEHIKSLSLYLWGPNNKRITESKSDSPNPMLGHCAKETGMYKFQAKVTGGGGHFKAGIYAK